jgi:hypothetical protein
LDTQAFEMFIPTEDFKLRTYCCRYVYPELIFDRVEDAVRRVSGQVQALGNIKLLVERFVVTYIEKRGLIFDAEITNDAEIYGLKLGTIPYFRRDRMEKGTGFSNN